ncbi:MAG: type II toxin-antitoxin system VapC family toxin [Mycobacteriales bacterium]
MDACVVSDALIDDGPVGRSARGALAVDSHWAAPTHLLVEVLSVVRGRTLSGKVKPARAREAIDAMSALVIDQIETVDLVERIWQLRDNLTAYDAAYVAAAELLGCPLLTGDARLAKAPDVRCEVRLPSIA